MKRAGSHARLSEPTFDAFGEKIDKGGMIVRARDLLEGFSPGLEKGVTSLLLKLFEGFEAICREGGRQHEKRFHSNRRQALELEIRIRRQPRLADQTGLKRNRMLFRRNSGPRSQCARGRKTLRPVTGGMRRRAGVAAICDHEAMGPR